MSAELLPCPFCGGVDTIITPQGRIWNGQRFGEASSYVVRHHCERVPGQPIRGIERVGRDEDSARAAWNTRATQPQAPQGAVTQKWRDVVADLATIVRMQNGNLHDDINTLLDRAKALLAAAPETPEGKK